MSHPSSNAAAWIERLGLEPHPEGGWFRETHRSRVVVPRNALPAGYPGDRCALTSILYLLSAGEHSRRHRVRSEEIWLHQAGDDLALRVAAPEGEETVHRLGRGPGARPQLVVPPGWWQSAAPVEGSHGFVLVGCVVAPGFERADFEVG